MKVAESTFEEFTILLARLRYMVFKIDEAAKRRKKHKKIGTY